MAKQQQKAGRGKTKLLLPVIKKFNAAAKLLLKSLTKQLEHEERELSRIKVMVNDIKIPDSERQHQISVTTVDMNQTKIKKKGDMSYNQVMDWEKKMRDRNRGTLL